MPEVTAEAPTVGIKYNGKTYTGTNSTTIASVSNDGTGNLWFDFVFTNAHTIKLQLIHPDGNAINFISSANQDLGKDPENHWTNSNVRGLTTTPLKFFILKYTDPTTYTAKITATGDGGTATASVKIRVNDTDQQRANVVAYAEMIQEDEWTLESGYILLYNKNYSPTYSNGTFSMNTPYIVSGTIRGIPYTLSSNNTGGGAEKTYSLYKNLSDAEKTAISKIYTYSSGNRISAKYGMSCATFVTDCIRQGFPNTSLSTYALTNFHTNSSWSKLITQGTADSEGYSQLLPGDYLYKGSHVMLVVKNTGSSINVIEQTPASWTCNNPKTETIALEYDGKTYTFSAQRLCMTCSKCEAHTTGTSRNTYSYSTLASDGYYAMYVNYGQ